MTKLLTHLKCAVSPEANASNLIIGNGYRITVITSRLLRVERQKENIFNDAATQCFFNRNLGDVYFSYEKNGNFLEIKTEYAVFYFDEKKKKINKITLDGDTVKCNNCGNLKGTARTLDMDFGCKKLGLGIISKKGVAVIDDSKSLLIIDGEVREKNNKSYDEYIFAYGKDYRSALKDFYKISGQTPMLPRFALGSWWSRYKAYTQEEYLSLMERFEKEKLPFTVATVDMDWHWVDVNKEFGTKFKRENPLLSEGWTGYSWNAKLFPDYRQFLKTLKEKKYRITLNLHPASGIRHYEDMYPQMAKSMGIDSSSQKKVEFDITDPKFINNYFEILHHPYEKDGVDFWWMDWQQGKKSKVKGLDPLWSLNHYHYLDNQREGKRALLLSRFSGIGAHRYPIGFSGDAIACWSSLRFQPYFTISAANIGYGWWSHDIGGHNFGTHDDELYLRWCQFGIFSPINRLHSSNHDLQGKEPWNYRDEVRRIVNDCLRLRHRMIPYLYTMNYRAHKEGICICEPMYYSYPEREESYIVKNQYMFGSELIVAPIVRKNSKRLNKAKVNVWLPVGRYTDIFTGRIYQGNKFVAMYRDWTSIPVLAKEGAIIPLANYKGNESGNPEDMDILIYRGNNSFTLYEDDGLTNAYKEGKYALTTFCISENRDEIIFSIDKVENDQSATVKKRTYHLKFKDIINANVTISINGESKKVEFSDDIVIKLNSNDKAMVVLGSYQPLENPDAIESAKVILSRYQRGNIAKALMYGKMGKISDAMEFCKAVRESTFPEDVKEAVEEVMG